MIETEERIPKSEILKMYGISRITFNQWVKERGLPVIEVSTHSKFVRTRDLIEWENSMMEKG